MNTRLARYVGRTIKLSTFATLALTLGGCLVTSPYYGQKFSSRTSSIPVQAWTTKTSSPVKIECAQSGRFGPAPLGGSVSWEFVSNLSVSTTRVYDAQGQRMYTAGAELTVPGDCWRFDGTAHYTALRISQTNYMSQPVHVFSNFRQSGLECLGREVGKAASWLGWSEKDCVNTYTNSGNPIPFIVLAAES